MCLGEWFRCTTVERFCETIHITLLYPDVLKFSVDQTNIANLFKEAIKLSTASSFT